MNQKIAFLPKILFSLAVFCLLSETILAESSVIIAVDPKISGAMVSSNFIGLSYEMSLVAPAENGGHFFSPANKPLIKMFQTLGIQSLRVGGNTAERATVKIPDKADIDSLFAFARSAGVKVIYTLRLNGNDPIDAAKTAKYIMDNYRPELACFALGNEPDKLVKDSEAYGKAMRNYMAVITAAAHTPEAVFCGPNTTQKNVQWANDFAKDFAHNKHVIMVTQHEYPAGSGRVATNAVVACEKLLSTNLPNVYEKLYANFVPAVLSSGLQYRLEEANSFSNGGASGASDAFASALWGLDYMYWWASHGADGINFHTGGYAGGMRPPGMKYVVFWNSPNGFSVRPLGYAIKAFDLGSHGNLIPVNFISNTDHINLTAYGVLSRDNSLYITIINKENIAARAAGVTIATGNSYSHAQTMFLTVTNDDVAATSGMALGGVPINDDGSWKGSWISLAAPFKNGRLSMKIPAATAVVLKLTMN